MTRRERIERRLERRLQWADSRDRRSAAGFERARVIADGIPLGQPILVGHHSEKRHRRDIDRIDRGMREGVESNRMAAHHRSKADGLEQQLERSIFSDDPDAVERLEERIAELEDKRTRIKAVNAAVRKHGLERLCQPDPPFTLTADEAKSLLQTAHLCPYHRVEKRGFPSYVLQNLGGNINRQKQRLAHLRARARVAAALREEVE